MKISAHRVMLLSLLAVASHGAMITTRVWDYGAPEHTTPVFQSRMIPFSTIGVVKRRIQTETRKQVAFLKVLHHNEVLRDNVSLQTLATIHGDLDLTVGFRTRTGVLQQPFALFSHLVLDADLADAPQMITTRVWDHGAPEHTTPVFQAQMTPITTIGNVKSFIRRATGKQVAFLELLHHNEVLHDNTPLETLYYMVPGDTVDLTAGFRTRHGVLQQPFVDFHQLVLDADVSNLADPEALLIHKQDWRSLPQFASQSELTAGMIDTRVYDLAGHLVYHGNMNRRAKVNLLKDCIEHDNPGKHVRVLTLFGNNPQDPSSNLRSDQPIGNLVTDAHPNELKLSVDFQGRWRSNQIGHRFSPYGQRSQDWSDYQCWNCGRWGHIDRHCQY